MRFFGSMCLCFLFEFYVVGTFTSVLPVLCGVLFFILFSGMGLIYLGGDGMINHLQ